jgi:hypothetical protein
MAAVAVKILQPVHGARIAGAADVRLQGQLPAGGGAGLFFKWYSTLNGAATAANPELNAADHGLAKLDWNTPLDVGTHVITLAAADQEGSALAAIQAVTRAGFSGGAALPGNPSPCVIHRFWAILKTPASDGLAMSKASATLVMRAPSRWAKETATGSGIYVKDPDYHAVNGIRYRFHFAPDLASPDPAKSADVIPAADDFSFFIDPGDHKPYLRWQGILPGNLAAGANVMTLFAESLDGTVGHAFPRKVNLTA